ncbi:hypothetical protein A2382_04350 [Candidatus Woesebacteria bacterium RIFOXYB1_FULL_38_16]|uniref:Membrane insertase YidC/Oxa/ALB C-terminal domain-containing protein n=1 Tax=Candidatus Woesebacteria bacterium RIFOXYB1_FULL_38_16 TaxID=1802538 RepID=A0A1F8CU44_9BACT|nr:MAG: hypothetical protein A2191_04430 [Candidatus Woesebacteria bacterium RIFOXYA1_FULL_38_9]OGM79801.1 MAG: hypothetical protein A2382_04350 [Candidatus Woesebacteria bacterium RIFOXYB1_FULL_38_16]
MNIFSLLFTQPLANGLALTYQFFGQNMGIAIILFSTFLRFALTPLTKPYMDSMKKIKSHQKDLDKLKKKYKDDKQGLMKAQADFYKQNNINPGAGCLPYLLQIVILIALFRVFTNVLSDGATIVEKFNILLYEPLKFAANETINTKFLYFDITRPDKFTLPGAPFAIPGPIVILAAVVQLLAAKMSMPVVETDKNVSKTTPGKEDDFQTAMQSSMIYTFPLITLVVGLQFPSGLALYWLIFSLFQVIQQYSSSGWGGLTPAISKARKILNSR